jgi:hypothetical protein
MTTLKAIKAISVILLCAGLLQISSGSVFASSVSQIQLERDKFIFEKDNEERKNQTELLKAVISGFSLAVPILIGIYTLRVQNKNNFDLKAAEIVMDANNPIGVKRKAAVLQALFPARLSSDFSASFDPKNYISIGPSTDSKLKLLQIIVDNPGKEEEIVTLWRRMFPDDSLEQIFPGDFRSTSLPNRTKNALQKTQP